MARYSMQDGSVVDTDNAQASWQERTGWNFSNYISKATGLYQRIDFATGKQDIQCYRCSMVWVGKYTRYEWVFMALSTSISPQGRVAMRNS